MEKEINKLKQLFKAIKNEGWIKSKRKGPTGIGYTFECLINKEEDALPMPDFNGIEIKTIRSRSRRKIHLFSLVPDGHCEEPIKRIINKLGYTTKDNLKKRCYVEVYGNKYTQLGYYKRIKLKDNPDLKRIELIGINASNNSLCLNVSWSYDKLKERIESKTSTLAVIKADNKEIKGEEYFLYEKINFYKLKNFDNFIELINNGMIKVNIKIEEEYCNSHGIDFSILDKNIEMLYEKINL